MWLMWECVKWTDVAYVGVCQVDSGGLCGSVSSGLRLLMILKEGNCDCSNRQYVTQLRIRQFLTKLPAAVMCTNGTDLL